MRGRTIVGLALGGLGLYFLLRPREASAAEGPPKPVPGGSPPQVPPPAPPLPPWPAPADLAPVPNIPPAEAGRPLVDRNLVALFLALRSPADPPLWLLYATAELGGGLRWVPLPPPVAGTYPPMGLTGAQVVEVLPALRGRPDEILRAVTDLTLNVAIAAALLKRYYDQAVAIVQGAQGQGDLDDVAHLVRLAWLYGPAAFDLVKVWRDAPSWYVESKPGELSHAAAWDRAYRRWSAQGRGLPVFPNGGR